MTGPTITRRTALLGALAIGAAGAVGATAYLPSAADGKEILSSSECEIVAAVAITLFPGGPFPVNGAEAGVVAEVDRIVAHSLTPASAAGFRYLLRTLQWGTVASRGSRFSDLDAATRTDVLQTWADPGVLPRRLASDAFKMVFGMAYFANAEVLDHIGYRPTCSAGLA